MEEHIEENIEQGQEENSVPQEIDAQQSESVADDFDRSQWAYKYKGQTLYPKDKQHMLTLMQQAHDANVRSEDVKRRMSEIDTMRKQYEQYQKLDDAFKQNPDFARKIWAMYQNNGTAETSDEDEPGYVRDLRQQVTSQQEILNQVRSMQDEWKQKEADKLVQTELEELKNRYPNHDWDTDEGDGSMSMRIIKHAITLGSVPLETAYRDYMWDTAQVNAKSEALKKAKETRAAQKRAGVVMDGASGGPQKQQSVDVRTMNWNQILNHAMKEI